LTFGGNARLPERHEDLSILIQFENLLAFAIFGLPIGDPDISITIDCHPMSLIKREVSETLQKLAGRRKFENHRISPVKDPDVTLCIHVGRDDRFELDVCWKLRSTVG